MKKSILLAIFLFFSIGLTAEDKKVALLFLTRSDLNHTELWKDWIDLDKYTIYNHPKSQVKDPWFTQFKIQENHQTSWGFILFAERALFKEALKDPLNYKFVLLTESCVPLRSSLDIHTILTSDDSSYMRWTKPWWKKQASRALSEFPKKHRLGNHSYYILNRKHAEMIANDNHWISLAMKHKICDESYPATFFSMNHVLQEFKNELTTYVDWERSYNKGPYIFKTANEQDVALLLNAKHNPMQCLFARKIAPEFPDDVLKLIQNN